jgi:hypothetical protein
MTKAVKTDPQLGESVVDEVRAIREAIDEEVGHDVARLAERARRVSDAVRREFGMRTAKLPPSAREASAGGP